MSRAWILALLLFLVLLSGANAGETSAHSSQGHPAAEGLVITPSNPKPGSATPDQTPNITAVFTDSAGAVSPDSVVLTLDGYNVTTIQGFYVTSTAVYYQPVPILKLQNGLHNVTVSAKDSAGNSASIKWNFTVNTSLTIATPPLQGFNVFDIVIDIAIGAGIAAAIFAGYILYLRQTRNFTFRKYFATHPIQREYLSLYVPLVVAFVFIILAYLWYFSTPGLPPGTPEYLAVVAAFIGLLTFSLDARRELARMRSYERSFAQLLFEMADAMRGGIDPAKAVVELSKTHTDILRKPLRVAADGIRMGRPFDQVVKSMAEPMKSPLISRYAELIADAATVGGETAAVIHRAAKDMDDFIKIEVERRQALSLPVAVLYLSFGILMAVLFALLSIAPDLGSISLNIAGFSSGSPLSGSSANTGPPKLVFSVLRERFLDLSLINALGTGVIIGAFTEGKAKYGLVHGLVLLAATCLAFIIFAPNG